MGFLARGPVAHRAIFGPNFYGTKQYCKARPINQLGRRAIFDTSSTNPHEWWINTDATSHVCSNN